MYLEHCRQLLENYSLTVSTYEIHIVGIRLKECLGVQNTIPLFYLLS
jgi:hypothetical protein